MVNNKSDTIGLSANQVDLAFMCSLYHIIYTTSIEEVKDRFIDSIKKALKKDGTLVIVGDLGAHALVVLSTLGEVLTIALAVVFLGERHDLTTWLGIILVVCGIAIVLQAKLLGEQQASSLRGIAFGLLSVLCMSVSIIIAKEALASVSAIQATFIPMVSGTLGMFFLGMTTQQLGIWMLPLRDFKLVGNLFLSVCFITFGGFWLSLVSIKYVDVSIANTLNTTDPIFVLPLAAIFLKEKITLGAVVGTAVTMAGIILLCNRHLQ